MAQMITRCPACGTRFRVVPDQLRISQGWVRCGQCSEIFDAAQQLDEPPLASPQSELDAPTMSAEAAGQVLPPGGEAEPALVQAVDAQTWPDTEQLLTGDSDASPPGSAAADAPQWLPHAPAEIPVADSVASLDVGLAEYVQAQAGVSAAEPEPAPPETTSWVPELHRASAADGSTSAAPERLVITLSADAMALPLRAAPSADAMPLPRRPAVDAPPPEPVAPRVVAAAPPPAPLDPALAELSFLREAEPAVPVAPASGATLRARVLWSTGVGLALVVLLWQLAVHERDRLAASAPGLRPLLGALCAPLGCSVQPLRRIDAIVIDGSSFQALGDSGYRLSLTLRNRAAHAVALPAIALALTDISEQAVVRRVLLPQDLGTAPAALDAHGEWTASVELQMADNAGRARVVGYRVDPFYP